MAVLKFRQAKQPLFVCFNPLLQSQKFSNTRLKHWSQERTPNTIMSTSFKICCMKSWWFSRTTHLLNGIDEKLSFKNEQNNPPKRLRSLYLRLEIAWSSLIVEDICTFPLTKKLGSFCKYKICPLNKNDLAFSCTGKHNCWVMPPSADELDGQTTFTIIDFLVTSRA